MAKKPKTASVSQILLVSYLLITAPPAWFGYNALKSIDDDIALHEELVSTGELVLAPESSTVVQVIGVFLRSHSAPFTHPIDNDSLAKTTEFRKWAESRCNTRATVVYFWILFMVIAAIAYLWLAAYLQRIFKGLSSAITDIGADNLTQKNSIEKPFDLSDVSSSLENLGAQMSLESEQQQRFLRHISHEIKTPLTSIKEGSKLLDEQLIGQMNREQQEITNILVRSSAALQDAIESLLDYNASIAPKKLNQRRRLNLADLILKALKNNRLSIKQKNLRIDSRLDDCYAKVNYSQILSVFDNLISNAIKHSPKDAHIRIQLHEDQASQIVFLIQDQGAGIKTHDQQFIFDPFYVGAQEHNTSLKGTGLGLSIAKQYTLDHGGELSLIGSRKGALFRVALPSN